MSNKAYGSITITDLLDTATYIYYSATGSSSVAGQWHKGVQSGDLYIGIYSGPPLDGGQPTNPTSDILNQLVISKYVGDTGISIINVTPLYYAKENNTAPNKPTVAITKTTTAGGEWTKGIPELTSTYPYMFTCEQVQYDSTSVGTNGYTWTTPVLNNMITKFVENYNSFVAGDTEWKNTYGQKVTTIEDTIDNFQIGGRNLLLNTSTELSETILPSKTKDSDVYIMSDFGETWRTNANVDDQYSLSFDYEVTNNTTSGLITPKLYGINCLPQNWDSSNKKGHYSETHKLVSSQISSTAKIEDRSPYSYRQKPNNFGKEVDLEIVGGSVGWNQLAYDPTFTTAIEWSARYGTVSVSNNIATVTPTSNGTLRGLLASTRHYQQVISGHKYLLGVDVLSPITSNVDLSLQGADGASISITANTWKRCETIYSSVNATQTRLACYIQGSVTTSQTIQYKNAIVVDLTLAFGSTIADYVYSLETATAGAGVTWLKEHFPKMFGQYNAYDAGSIKNVEGVSEHKMVGKNLLPNEGTSATIQGITYTINSDGSVTANGTATAVSQIFLKRNLTLPEGTYTISGYASGIPNGGYNYLRLYSASLDKAFSDYSATRTERTNSVERASDWVLWISIASGVTVNNAVFKPQLELGSTATAYEPYRTWSYPLDSSVTLRGIPKLDASNNLYYDGDTYASNGTVTRKYGIVDLGTLAWNNNGNGLFSAILSPYGMSNNSGTNVICAKYPGGNAYGSTTNKLIQVYGSSHSVWVRDTDYDNSATFKSAMNGVYLVYELATPTTESATSFLNPQTVGSTEEYVTDSIVPVGQNSQYISYDNAVRFLLSETSGNEADIKISNVKLEKGNEATDWTLAPEDIETRVTEFESSITQTAEKINSEVKKISSAKYVNSATSSWSLTNIKTYAAEGHSDNWNVTSTDNLREGDTVYVVGTDSTRNCKIYIKTTVTSVNSGTNFTGTSHGYEDVLPVETIKSTINQSADSVKIQANHVDIAGAAIFTDGRLSQTSLNNAYDAKGAASAVQTNLDNLSIGGRNLIKNTDSSTVIERAFPSSSSASYFEGYTATITRVDGISEYVASFDAKASVDNLEVICYWYSPNTTTRGESSTGQTSSGTAYDGNTKITLTTSWQRYWVKWKQSDTASTDKHLILCRQMTKPSSGTNTVYIRAPKMETGSKATDWTPAPEDLAPKTSAVAEEQYIYISKASGTSSVTGTTTWITETGDVQNTWSTKRPTYNSSYPVLFVAKQKKVVSGTVTCTTPVKDDTTTVIDGGHITTGTIDASKATITNINAANITSGTIAAARIGAGTITTSKLGEDALAQMTWYAASTSAADATAKVATITPTTTSFKLNNGVTVYVKFSVTNTAAVGSLTLNVNSTGAKSIKYIYNNSIANLPAANYLIAGATYQFFYDGTYWICANMNYNTNSNNYDRTLYNIYIKAETAITAGKLIWSNGTAGYKHLAASTSYNLSYPILYASAAIAASAQAATAYSIIPQINPATTGTVQGIAVNKPVYLKGTVNGRTFTTAASNWLTCTVPTTKDGYYYIMLGIVANDATTKMFFISDNTLYKYVNGAFQQAVTTIEGDRIFTGTIQDTTGKNSWNLDTGKLTITDGSVNITTSADDTDYITLLHGNTSVTMASNYFNADTTDTNYTSSLGADKISARIGGYTTSGGVKYFGLRAIASKYDSQKPGYNATLRSSITPDEFLTETLDPQTGAQQVFSSLSPTGLVINNNVVYPPTIIYSSVVGSPNTDNVTSYSCVYKYGDYNKMIWTTATYNLSFPSTYGALYFSTVVIALPPAFFSTGTGNVHFIASARSSLGIYSTNVYTWDSSTGAVSIFVGTPQKPSSGYWSVQIELFGTKF